MTRLIRSLGFTLGYESDAWRVTAYLRHYDWSLLSNFTFFLEDAVNSDAGSRCGTG